MSATAAPRRRDLTAVAAAILLLAAAAWAVSLWTMRSSTGATMDMSMGMGASTMALSAFIVVWVAMMAAMMLPAVAPVTQLYARAARRGIAAATPVFVSGYLAVWAAAGVPAFVAYRALAQPLADGATWTGRLAGGALLLAGVYTFTPLKAACLRHCRSPLSFFMTLRGDLRRPAVALRAGMAHGLFCFGCCWALMAVLVAVGVMSVTWMLALAAVIFVEKTAPHGRHLGRVAAAGGMVLGVLLLVQPALLSRLI